MRGRGGGERRGGTKWAGMKGEVEVNLGIGTNDSIGENVVSRNWVGRCKKRPED